MQISVVIPTYNRAFCLERAIESVLQQSFPPFEIIVCDDGSTDHTKQLLAKVPVRTLWQKNKGVSSARNFAIAKSRGNWIALLDSDDAWHRDKLKLQAQEIVRTNTLFCHTDEAWIKNNRWINPKKHLVKSNENIFERSLTRCSISPSSVLINKDLLTSVGCFDQRLKIAEDYDCWLKILLKQNPSFINSKLVTRYAGHACQLSMNHSIDYFRIQTLQNLMKKTNLTKSHYAMIAKELAVKTKIYQEGRDKRAHSTPLNKSTRPGS